MPQPTVPHIELLRVKNYRALRDIELKQLIVKTKNKETLLSLGRFG